MPLLDFTYRLEMPEYTAYANADDPEAVCVVPKNLGVHSDADGKPVFYLELIRGITPFSKPKPYGMLELQLTPIEIHPDWITQIREEWPAAKPYTPDFSSGYLGLTMVAADGEVRSDELEAPTPLSRLPLSRLRLVKRVSIDYVSLVKEALHKGLMLLQGYGFTTVKGFAPKIPLILEFNPQELTTALLTSGETAEGPISLDTIKNFFKKPLEELPFILKQNDTTNSPQLPDCLTDWFISRFCTLVPPTSGAREIYFSLNSDALTTGRFVWDLSEPLVAERHTFFTMDALKEARDLVMARGMEALFTTTVVEPLPTGFLRVEVYHPFYEIPTGIRQIGVKINAAPNPPFRNQAIHETVVFNRGQQKKVIILHFSPKEEPRYEFIPYAIYGDSSGTKEALGAKKITGETEIMISEEDYPFSFRSFSCSPNIQAQASLSLLLYNVGEDAPMQEPITLNSEQSQVTLAFPEEEVTSLECRVTAKNLISEDEVATTLSLISDHKIDLTLFREYGSHEVVISWNTNDGHVIGLDLIPEYLEPDPSNTTTIALSNDGVESSWSWFAPSIFKAGFRYRLHGEEDGQWSEIQSPFTEKLVLTDQIQAI